MLPRPPVVTLHPERAGDGSWELRFYDGSPTGCLDRPPYARLTGVARDVAEDLADAVNACRDFPEEPSATISAVAASLGSLIEDLASFQPPSTDDVIARLSAELTRLGVEDPVTPDAAIDRD